MHPRIEIVRRIDDIKDHHCATCEEIMTVNQNVRNTYCRERCDLGKELINLGDQLTDLTIQKRANKPKSKWSDLKPLLIKKKPKEMSAIKTVEEKRSESKMELTKETFLKLSGEGKTNKEIMKMFGMNNVTFYKLKNDWGLVNSKFSKSKPSEDEKKEAPEIKMTDEAPKEIEKQCDCKRELHEQIASLQAELSQRQKEIQDLHKYKKLYVSTVEALKVHLP